LTKGCGVTLRRQGISALFNRQELEILSIHDRKHGLGIDAIRDLSFVPESEIPAELQAVAEQLMLARSEGASVIFMMGGHVIRSGVQRYIIDLIRKGYITCIAMNGAGVIHDFEFSLIGATTESVADYIAGGQFGLWKETAIVNDIVNAAFRENSCMGFGESVGRTIAAGTYPHKNISILANAVRCGVAVTVHIGIGYDITHEHPNFDGAAAGALSYNDFLKFASVICGLENGVVMNFGSAVMAPEVFLKALSMARNIARQNGKGISKFTALVCDLYKMTGRHSTEPAKESPEYYFRPWKTMLVRTVQDGGKSYYVQGDHAITIPALWTAIQNHECRKSK